MKQLKSNSLAKHAHFSYQQTIVVASFLFFAWLGIQCPLHMTGKLHLFWFSTDSCCKSYFNFKAFSFFLSHTGQQQSNLHLYALP